MFDPYIALIFASVLIILSYFFDLASKKFKVPSVLFLLGTGIIIKKVSELYNINISGNFLTYLEFIGIIGMIMIVLEGAVDLNLSRRKLPLIRKSIFLALIVLIISSFSIGTAIMYLLDEPFFNSFIYAIPMSVVSAAVLIPSVHTLTESKKEFLIYESTFSDIIGIMFFNFVVIKEGSSIFTISGTMNIVITVIASILVSYVLVYLFSKVRTDLKIFLIINIENIT